MILPLRQALGDAAVHLIKHRDHDAIHDAARPADAKLHANTAFFSAFPMFVPSLSWQSDHL